jgi:hypothetical protein
MIGKSFGRAAVAASFLVAASVASADEIVYFTNGAEMPVRSHSIDKDMVKLDLGGNSTISFPVNMVTKIANAGQEVFVNPNYQPVNQAVPGSAAPANGGSQPVPVQNMMVTGGGGNTGFRQRPGHDAGDGTMYGEPAIGEDNSKKFVKVDGTVGRSDPRHPFLSTVTRPLVDGNNPIPPFGQGVVDVPNQGAPAQRHSPFILKPPGQSAAGAPVTPPPPPPPPPAPEDNAPAPSDPGTQGSDPSN